MPGPPMGTGSGRGNGMDRQIFLCRTVDEQVIYRNTQRTQED